MDAPSQRVTREDLLMFVNACFACTGQREFYSDGHGQAVSIDFLHQYILGNYRRLYARVLACGVNHMNQALVIGNLLASGKDTIPHDRAEENALITRALRVLPVHRAMHVLERVAQRGVNNRRFRSISRRFLEESGSREFRFVKYRRAAHAIARHAHLNLSGEAGAFLFRGWKERRFKTPLFESFREAHYAEKAIYELPFSIAEGRATKHGVPRDVFLRRIAPRLTHGERLRLQSTSREHLGAAYDIDWARQPITKIASYVLSLSMERRSQELESFRIALRSSAERAAVRIGARFGRVALVLDRSYSSSGSNEKRRRPLAVALATAAFLRASSASLTLHWTNPVEDEVLVTPYGQTDLCTPILGALRTNPELLIVVSDGYDNDPPNVAGQVLEAARRTNPGCFVLHVNPVYDVESFAPKGLSPNVPTMGIRDPEDLPTLAAFARFSSGDSTQAELDACLDERVRTYLSEAHDAP